MRRTTVTLPDHISQALARAARRRHTSASEITRQALAAHLGLANGEPRHLAVANLGDSGQPTTGRDSEEILRREWNPDRDR